MWAPIAVALSIGVLAQVTSGMVGLAIAYSVLLVAAVGFGVGFPRTSWPGHDNRERHGSEPSSHP